MSQQKINCRDRKWGEYDKFAATYQFMLRHKKKTEDRIYVATKSPYVATLIIAIWKSLLRQKEEIEEKPLSRQDNLCRDTV